MAVFMVERTFPPGITDAERAANGFRSDKSLFDNPKVTWLRSYYDPVSCRSLCFYDADSAESVRKHSEDARIPCDSVTEVEAIEPGS